MDLAGWRETTWGMTKEEIIAVVGRQNITSVQRNFYGPSGYRYCDDIVTDLNIIDRLFTAHLIMSGETDKLVSVILKPEPANESGSSNDMLFAKKVIEERFELPQRIGTDFGFYWTLGRTYITLIREARPDGKFNVNLGFFCSKNNTFEPRKGAF